MKSPELNQLVGRGKEIEKNEKGGIVQKPFRRYKLDEERDEDDITFTVRITLSDREWFKQAKIFIRQPKNSTALKQLAEIGSMIVLHDDKIGKILEVIRDNFRKNTRVGVAESEYNIKKS